MLTAPEDVILRILLFAVSAIYRFPAESIAIPVGRENLADVPFPFRNPCVPPANVLTLPEGVIFIIARATISVRYIFPDESTTIPAGYPLYRPTLYDINVDTLATCSRVGIMFVPIV